MSCSPPGSGWSAATWTQLPLPTATQVLTTAPFGGDQQQQLPSLRTSFPGGSSSNAGCGYLGAAVNRGSGGFTGGAVNNTSEKRCSSAPAPDNVSPLRDQVKFSHFQGPNFEDPWLSVHLSVRLSVRPQNFKFYHNWNCFCLLFLKKGLNSVEINVILLKFTKYNPMLRSYRYTGPLELQNSVCPPSQIQYF